MGVAYLIQAFRFDTFVATYLKHADRVTLTPLLIRYRHLVDTLLIRNYDTRHARIL